MSTETKTACLRFTGVPCQRTWSDFFRNRSYLGYAIFPANTDQDNGLPVGHLYQDKAGEYYFGPNGRALGRFALLEIADKLEALNKKDSL